MSLVALSVAACSGGKPTQPGAQSPEQQSDKEYLLAVDAMQKNNPREALQHALKSAELDDQNEKVRYVLALIYGVSFCDDIRGLDAPDCRLGESEKWAREALKIKPTFRDATNVLGTTLINEKKYKEAIAVLEPLTKDPAYVNPQLAWGNFGWAQVLDGQVDAGIGSLHNAIAAEPRFCPGFYHLGVAFQKKGDLAKADATFAEGFKADPACEHIQDAWEARCRGRMQLGKIDDAKADCEKCRALSSESATGKTCIKLLATMNAAPQAAAAANP